TSAPRIPASTCPRSRRSRRRSRCPPSTFIRRSDHGRRRTARRGKNRGGGAPAAARHFPCAGPWAGILGRNAADDPVLDSRDHLRIGGGAEGGAAGSRLSGVAAKGGRPWPS